MNSIREAEASCRLDGETLSVPTSITFTVYGIAQTAGSKRSFALTNKNTGEPVRRPNGSIVVNTVDDNPKSSSWKNAVASAGQEAWSEQWGEGVPLLDGALRVTLTFFFPRPKGHYGKNGLRPSAPTHHITRPDVLKLARAVEDALTGVIWRDDAQIATEVLRKAYGEPARVEIQVELAEVEAARRKVEPKRDSE